VIGSEGNIFVAIVLKVVQKRRLQVKFLVAEVASMTSTSANHLTPNPNDHFGGETKKPVNAADVLSRITIISLLPL
jgi:hypothetical protein